MSQGTKQQAVRLPVELHAKIVAAATENNRSGHAEMLHRLEQSFTESSGIVDMVRGDLNALEERLLKKLAPEVFVTDLSLGGDVDLDALRELLKGDPSKPGLFFPVAKLSPTGRLKETQPELQAFPHGGEYNARKVAHARARAAEFCRKANDLDDSVQEISGLSTLPQAMRKRGGMCDGGYVSSAGLGPYEVPATLTIPGALEWDRPGEETSWRVHDGLNPVGLCISADTIVEVERRDGVKLPADRAGDFNWIWDASLLPGKDPAEIYAWRLVPGQAEYPEGWLEHTGTPPVGSKVRVDLKYRNGHTLTGIRARNVDWYNNLSHPADEDITHWRIAR